MKSVSRPTDYSTLYEATVVTEQISCCGRQNHATSWRSAMKLANEQHILTRQSVSCCSWARPAAGATLIRESGYWLIDAWLACRCQADTTCCGNFTSISSSLRPLYAAASVRSSVTLPSNKTAAGSSPADELRIYVFCSERRLSNFLLDGRRAVTLR